MNRRTLVAACLGLLVASFPAYAITPGDDLLIPGAARTSLWVDDLYINNPGSRTVSVDVMWLQRGQANLNPDSRTFSIAPDETLILPDVIRNTFGWNRRTGAFRITATGGVVTANLIARAVIDDENGRRTHGSGFEAVPAASATGAGETTNLMGMTSTSAFRTNLMALAGKDGVTMDLYLLDPNGDELDIASVTLEAYQPWLSAVTDLWDVASFDNGTAQARVSSGSMVIFGSKIDEHPLSQDPTTLESAFGAGAGSADGTYQFAVYDRFAFASGGNLTIDDDMVEAINGTYINFDKVDGGGVSECTLIFLWGIGLSPTPVEDFETGVEFTDTYPDGGDMTWTVKFTVDDNLGFSGTIDAVGTNFTDPDTGCNGTFPFLCFYGGKGTFPPLSDCFEGGKNN